MKMSKNEAVEKMVTEFQSIPAGILEKLIKCSQNMYIEEVTPPSYWDKDEHCSPENPCNQKPCNVDFLPMWGTLWAVERIRPEDFEALVKIGFRIYEVDDYDGFVLGIDAAGFSFYDHYWLPLYNYFGYKWHSCPYKWNEVRADQNGDRIYYEQE